MENEGFDPIKKELTAYGESLGKVGKLRLIGIISRVLGLFLLIFCVSLMVFAILAFGSVAAIQAMSGVMPVWAASLIMGGAYIVLIVVVIACRKPLFIHPFIHLLSKQIRSEEELALKTLEAEHTADIHYIRLETRVQNAVSELSFYTSFIRRIWNWLSGKIHK